LVSADEPQRAGAADPRDSLIVPRSAVGHVGGALDSAFSYAAAKVRVRWEVEVAPDVARA